MRGRLQSSSIPLRALRCFLIRLLTLRKGVCVVFVVIVSTIMCFVVSGAVLFWGGTLATKLQDIGVVSGANVGTYFTYSIHGVIGTHDAMCFL